jgi:hypothetical protein
MEVLFISSIDTTAHTRAAFGAGSGRILLKNVACTGNEANITSCTARTDTSYCTHNDDAGVRCNAECEHINGVAGADLGGSSIVLKFSRAPPFCPVNNEKWVWLFIDK